MLSTSQLHGHWSGGPGGWNQQTPIWTSACSQQVIQPNGQVHQLVGGEGGVPAGQLSTDVLAETAAIMVNQAPVVPYRAGSQVPKLKGELLGAPRPLPQEEAFTCRLPSGGWSKTAQKRQVNSSNWSNAAYPALHTVLAHSRAFPVRHETSANTW